MKKHRRSSLAEVKWLVRNLTDVRTVNPGLIVEMANMATEWVHRYEQDLYADMSSDQLQPFCCQSSTCICEAQVIAGEVADKVQAARELEEQLMNVPVLEPWHLDFAKLAGLRMHVARLVD